MTSPREFLCQKHTNGVECLLQTRLYVSVTEYGDLGVCAGHAADLLAACQMIWPEAKLRRWAKSLVERWGAVDITIEDAVFSPCAEPDVGHPDQPRLLGQSKHERTGCFHPAPCPCPDLAKS